jgi:hypothetical protein
MPTAPLRKFVIWSIEHDAWWRPGWAGYTRELAAAGRYDQAGADEILARANFVKVNECAIPLACLGQAFACPRCGRTSYHPKDVQERYCGACHEFFPEERS